MDCADEVAAIERVLKPLAGVREVRANLMGGTVTVAHEASVSEGQLIEAIARAGLKASGIASGGSSRPADAQRSRLIAVGLSGAFTGLGLVLQWSRLGPPALPLGAFGIAIIAGGWFIFPKAVAAARRFSPDMNLLMTVAVVGAVAIGEWSEGAAVTFLFAVAEVLEAFSVARARRAIQSLMQLSPETAWLKQGDSFKEVPVGEVKVGDLVAVKSGSRVPLDGEVIAGASAINQAPITGESMPVEKKVGDTVFAGTINGEGSLEVRVTKLSTDTTLAKIIHLVEEAQSQKAPSQRFVDVFARYYTPAVMLLALLVLLVPPLLFGGTWAVWTYRALVLLVIACPCALVIATPVAIVSGLTALARRGVLIKGGALLEAIGKLRALAVDKTGTITEGRPRVTKVSPMNGRPEAELVRIAAAIDIHSTHPLAQAVVDYARQKGIEAPRGENYQGKTGRGAEAELEGHHYFVGNHRFTHELAVCSEAVEQKLAEIEADAQSVVVVGHKPHADCPGEVLGILAVGDTIRPNAASAIQALHAAGVQKVVMLSGDNQRTVDAIARQAGIDEAHGDLLPDQKISRVQVLLAQHRYVGMIGDGVNDAPAMAAASVGIAMGAAGTDTAIETADMALMQDDLSQVAEAIRLGRRTVRVIQANIGFALGVKAIFLVLALTGHTSLWLAILADTGATLVVIANALRLLRANSGPANVSGEDPHL
ncbi:heavy metal translocating P-type ATPase [Fontisphaera persica]|uniref:heavy metal translocating P-type ATPase n=1 Tax=Fontisphaera persica TaxID=2974023 RepID=UPI003CCDB6CD